MNVRRAGMVAGEAKSKADQPVVVESAENVTSGFAGDDEYGRRDKFRAGIAPDVVLEFDARFEFREGVARTNYKFCSNRLRHRFW